MYISFNLCKSDILQIHEYYTFVHYNTLFSLKLNMYDLVSMLLYNALPYMNYVTLKYCRGDAKLANLYIFFPSSFIERWL